MITIYENNGVKSEDKKEKEETKTLEPQEKHSNPTSEPEVETNYENSLVDFPTGTGEQVKNLPEAEDGILTTHIERLAEDYSKEIISSRRPYTPIHVDEIASRLAKFYEKIRKIIDWKEDNALRRGAIERILKRILFPNLAGLTVHDINIEELSETVTLELIRGGHLPNDTVPRERLIDVTKALKKYLYFLEYLSSYNIFEVKQKVNYATFILEIAACEIEEILTNPFKEYGIIKTMSEMLTERISVTPQGSLSSEEIKKNTHIATLKTLYDLDDNYIVYSLLKQRYPTWRELSPELLQKIAKELPHTWKEIENDLHKPVMRKFIRIAERIDTVFVLLDDILGKLKNRPKEVKAIFEDREKFAKFLNTVYEKRFQTLKTRLFRLAVFSTLSVFLSNWVTFYIVEVPLAKLFYEGFNFAAAVVDFVVPTAVMFFLVIIIRPPGKNNIKKVLATTYSFVYKYEEQQNFQIKIDKGKPSTLRIIMTAVYFEILLLVFAGIAYVFYIANLPMTSVIFDTFTISLTVFAAVAIKNKSKELNVDEEMSVWDFVLDMVSVPIARVGSIFARTWKEYNIVAIFFNFLIETPFAVVLNIIQGWSEFISERKSELH